MKREVVEVSETVNAMIAVGQLVAAICAATLALAHAGLLDDREHTSNGREFIAKYVHKYRGPGMYRASRAVRDHLVITRMALPRLLLQRRFSEP
jgi:putative intracellular protease/amidase